MKTFKLVWTQKSVNDLEEIHEYISIDSANRANKLIKEILNEVKRLKRFPASDKMIPELNTDKYKEIYFKSYRIQYKIEDKKIYILQVFHSKRFFKGF